MISKRRIAGLTVLVTLTVAGGSAPADAGPLLGIRRAPVDGTDDQPVLSAETAAALGPFALETDSLRMFWIADPVDSAFVTIRTATTAGTDIKDLLEFSIQAPPSGLAIDAVELKLYFTQLADDCAGDVCGAINRTNLDGSGGEMVRSAFLPNAIAVWPAGDTMCWSEQSLNRIRCADLNGAAVRTVATETSSEGVAINGATAKLYWTDSVQKKIRRSNLDGSDVEDLIMDLTEPWSIVLDPSSGTMWWSDRAEGTIRRAALDGSGAQVIVSGLTTPAGIALLGTPVTQLFWASGFSPDVPASSTWSSGVLSLLMLVTLTLPLARSNHR